MGPHTRTTAARVRVRFLQDEFEGREEWVPPARLKVLWADVESWLAAEQRWETLREASWRDWRDPECQAAETVIETCLDRDVASCGFNKNNGILFIRDGEQLAATLGVELTALTGHELSFVDETGAVAAPFSVMLMVAERLATLEPRKLLAYVEQQEAADQQAAIHGQYHAGRGRDQDWYVKPEHCAETAVEYALVYRFIRQWCGVEGQGEYNELKALRIEVRRLGHLIERAITAIRVAGDAKAAASLEQELGVPIETLRQQRSAPPS